VISTNPAPGDSVAKGGTVKVYVSKGAGSIKIPDVSKLSQQDAQSQLANHGFKNVVAVPDAQSTLPKDEVDHTSPPPGTSIPPGQQITLYVSGGGTAVPNVISGGLTQSEAQTVLNGDGFNNIHFIVVAAQNGQMVQPGTCYFQNPTAGTVKPTSTLITVYVQPAQTSTPTPSTSTTPTNSTSPTSTPTDTATATPTDTASSTPTDTGSTPPGPGNHG
jgi:eukaryotic-like serine/threonine-protein kinase